jgi:hypothetical protein
MDQALARMQRAPFPIATQRPLLGLNWERYVAYGPIQPGDPLSDTVDEAGIPYLEHEGQMDYRTSYIVHRILRMLDAYELAVDPAEQAAFLAYAVRITQKLTDTAVDFHGALVRYGQVDVTVYGYTFRAPWLSGLGQGDLLEVYARLYLLTRQPRYLQLAHRVFRSFFLLDSVYPSGHWIAHIDAAGYYWIEEHPKATPPHTLNGFLFAVSGLHTYYLASGEPRARQLLQAALTTVRDHIHQYRYPGDLSTYDLQHRASRPLRYHALHSVQLQHLYRISGEKTFLRMAWAFQGDQRSYETLLAPYVATTRKFLHAMQILTSEAALPYTERKILGLPVALEPYIKRWSFAKAVFTQMRAAHQAAMEHVMAALTPLPQCPTGQSRSAVCWALDLLQQHAAEVTALGARLTAQCQQEDCQDRTKAHLRDHLGEWSVLLGALLPPVSTGG